MLPMFLRQESLGAKSRQFFMGDHPLLGDASAAGTFRGSDATEPAPLPNCKLGSLRDPSDLRCRIELFGFVLLDQSVELCLNPVDGV